jgi:PhnB protein
LNPYLLFNGDCETAFKFYEKSLGARIEALLTHEGTPMEKMVPAEWRKKIIHARLKLGDKVLMASDCPPEHYVKPQGFSVNLDFKSSAEAERVFNALAEKGSVQMPLQQTFWAAKFGMVTDRFGTPWMINCESAA